LIDIDDDAVVDERKERKVEGERDREKRKN